MSDLVEWLRARGQTVFDLRNGESKFVVDPDCQKAADEIERLTVELDAALAKLAQYEQAPVVGWVPDDTATVVATRGYAMFSIYKDEPPLVIGEYVQLIARPEATHDST